MIPCVTAQRSILLAGTVAGVLLRRTGVCPATARISARRYATRGRTGCTDGAAARLAADRPP